MKKPAIVKSLAFFAPTFYFFTDDFLADGAGFL